MRCGNCQYEVSAIKAMAQEYFTCPNCGILNIVCPLCGEVTPVSELRQVQEARDAQR